MAMSFYGEEIKEEKILPHLKGYEDSSPVRIGNGVRSFLELDVYGEVIEAVTYLVRAGKTLDQETQKKLRGFGAYVCANWQKPDTGIWETAPPLQHYTHSKLMCWVALDRLIELQNRGQLKGISKNTIEQHRLIRKEIEDKGWNAKIQSYTQIFEGEELDPTALVIPLYEFDSVSSIRIQQTLRRVQERLSPAPGLIYRYEKSVQDGEGTFHLCSFWHAEFLARGGGTLQEVHEAFNQILICANDLGIFIHLINGWIFSFIYILTFEVFNIPTHLVARWNFRTHSRSICSHSRDPHIARHPSAHGQRAARAYCSTTTRLDFDTYKS